MATRTNLCPNPALTHVSTGWSGLGGGRRTNAPTSLPRITGWDWNTPAATGDLLTPIVTTIPGQSYVASMWVRADGADADAKLSIRWRNSGGSLISSSPVAAVLANQPGTRYEVGPVVAPAGAVQAQLCLNDVSVSAVATAVLFEQTSTTGGTYFDGESDGADWSGTVGNSPSVLTIDPEGSDSWSWSDSGSVTTSDPGDKVGGEGWSWSESTSVAATNAEPIGESWAWRDSGAIVSAGWDPRYGRIRIRAFGLPAAGVRAVVHSRPAKSRAWSQVRGGKLAISSGRFSRYVDDYEYVAGADMVYRIDVLASPEGAADELVGQVTITRPAPVEGVWLKTIAAPHRNLRVILSDFQEVARRARFEPYDVVGVDVPTVVTDAHSGRTVNVILEAFSIADADRLDRVLRSGSPLFLHTPVTNPLPSMYVVVGDYSWDRPTGAKLASSRDRARFSVPLVEVAAPPPSVVGAGATWRSLKEQHATWRDLLAARRTWGELL